MLKSEIRGQMSEAGGQCVGGRCVLQSRAARPACLPGASQKAEIGKAENTQTKAETTRAKAETQTSKSWKAEKLTS